MFIFLLDVAAERYVEMKYGVEHDQDVEGVMTGVNRQEHVPRDAYEKKFVEEFSSDDTDEHARSLAVRQQIAAFLILEFGVLFHSVIIGLNLGVSGDEFSTLYVVLVFHQSFEGLGIGARLSAIPFKKGSWVPWVLCAAYGLTTPLSIAIGLGVHTTYNPGSFTANVVSGVLDSISAGILIYTGFVELLARDFIFNPQRTKNNFRLAFMTGCVVLGAGLMALLGKWA
ncbi:Zinc-regulated transporter 1 [Cyphellophora attinorum]|uniref:Zinc-regulated transporter 1 n=1 Tax=Cyphellophora attinorum TaxID=1664694 RepID=A0A0N1H1F2_9EURO|nr:Zinc-regulated transporter 1 [Phialophora attinorum]KPI34582.1 Zinc-regulated transporter 1 [Phialophora attinorum]